MHASGIGGEHAADLGRALCGEGDGEKLPGFLCRRLHALEHGTRFDRHRAVDGVDRENAVHAGELQDQGSCIQRTLRIGGGSPHRRGVSALRNDDEMVFGGEPENCRNLFGRSRTKERKRLALAAPAGIERRGFDFSRIRNDVIGTEEVGKLANQALAILFAKGGNDGTHESGSLRIIGRRAVVGKAALRGMLSN